MALWFLVLSVVSLSLVAVENVTVMSMLSLSQSYAQAGPVDAALFQAPGTVVRWARNWAHLTSVLAGMATALVFYSALYRFALVPRALAGFAVVAAMLLIIGYVIPFFLGYRSTLLLIMPAALSHLALALWLTAKGFEERAHLVRADAHGAEVSGP